MNVIAPPAKVLVIGATGSIGRLVVAEALREDYRVRALVRSRAKAQRVLPPQAELAVGDVTQPETLRAAVDGVDAIIFSHGSDGGGKADSQNVDYGAVRNALFALGKRKVRPLKDSPFCVSR